MKILHVTQGYFPAIGGTEILIQRVSEELHRQFNDDVTVFTTNCYNGEAFFTPGLSQMPVGEENLNGIQVRRFPVVNRVSQVARRIQGAAYRLHLPGNQWLRLWAGGPVIPGLQRAIEQAEYDVAAASSFPLMHMFATLEGAHRSGRPCVLHGGIHPQDAWGFDRPMIYDAIRRADAYIANTAYEADFLIQRGISASKITVVGAGVDFQLYDRVSSDEARQFLSIPDDVPLVGFIGQIGGHKGVDALLRAMPQVWAVVPDAHLLIAGARTLFADVLDGILKSWESAWRDKVILRYNFSNEEKPLLFASLDVFAYPSGYESFGIAFAEAWAARKPVIGCWRGAVPWVVHPGRDGLLVPFQDPRRLAEAIILLLRNPRLRRNLGDAGYEKVVQRYSWPEIGRRFRAVYSTLVSAKQSGR
ncbi:MAG: glycosyltransferase family 1 protein [Calditrichaeota bacterium]|nr:MAG: glycosyltransferase family 1 protein [Calditrichota bacterium]